LILRVTLPLTTVALVVLGDDHLPGAHPVRLLVREDDLAGVILHAFEEDLDGVARPGGRLVLPLAQRHEAFRLVTDVDDDLVADHLDDLAGDDAADHEVLAVAEGAFDVVGPPFAGDHGGQFLVTDVEFAQQVAVYHSGSFRFPPRRRREVTPDRGPRSAPGPGSTTGPRVEGSSPGACGRPGGECEVPGKKGPPLHAGAGPSQKVIIKQPSSKTTDFRADFPTHFRRCGAGDFAAGTAGLPITGRGRRPTLTGSAPGANVSRASTRVDPKPGRRGGPDHATAVPGISRCFCRTTRSFPP